MTSDRGATMPFGSLDDAALEAALVDLGGAIAYPPAPDIATFVVRRLSAAPAPRRTRFVPGNLRWALVAALLALLLLAGAAIGFGWRLPGLVITFTGSSPTPAAVASPTPAPTGGASVVASAPVSQTAASSSVASSAPTVSPSPSRAGLGLGPPTTLGAAEAAVSFPVFVPTPAAVGEAAPAVYLDRSVPGSEVVLVYPAGPSLPAASTAPVDDFGRPVGLLITESTGTVDEAIIGKMAPPGTTVTEVTVNGRPGLWIAGAPHTIVIVENGEYREETLREVGNVLAWAQNGTLIRIELAGDLADAQAIAATMR